MEDDPNAELFFVDGLAPVLAYLQRHRSLHPDDARAVLLDKTSGERIELPPVFTEAVIALASWMDSGYIGVVNSDEPWATAADAADELGMTIAHLKELVDAGEIASKPSPEGPMVNMIDGLRRRNALRIQQTIGGREAMIRDLQEEADLERRRNGDDRTGDESA